MRIIHISDVHWDERRQLAGRVRLDDDGHNEALTHTAAAVMSVADVALAAGKVDLWVITGDLFDSPNTTQLEERVAIDVIATLATEAEVVIIGGNHDMPLAGSGATALECLKRRPRITVVERPTALGFTQSGRPDSIAPYLQVTCLPYPRRADLVEHNPGESREERNRIASDALRAQLTVLRAPMAPSVVEHILLFHGDVEQAEIGLQPRSMANDIALSPRDFAGFEYVGIGHIHKCQKVARNAWFAGSVDRVDFAEEYDVKGGLEIITTPGEEPSVKIIESAARRYVTLADESELTDLAPGVVYRIKAAVDAPRAAAIRRRVNEVSAAGAWIAPDLDVERVTTVRDAQATAGETSDDILERWLVANPSHAEAIAREFGIELKDVREEVFADHRVFAA